MRKIKKRWKRFFTLFLILVLVISMFPSNVLAVDDRGMQKEMTTETEETKKNETEAEKTKEENPSEEKESYIMESVPEEVHSETDLDKTVSEQNIPEATDAQQEIGVKELKNEEITVDAPVLYAANGETYRIYSDGTWSGGGQSGIVWYVGNKHYIFCLDRGKTMYNGQYTGKVTSGYSGKSAFKKAVAMHYFYKSNGNSWSGKKNYGPAQEVIWDETGSDAAKKLTTYIDQAWALTSLNTARKAGASSFDSKLTPIKKSEQESAAARKKMIAGIKKMQKISSTSLFAPTFNLSGGAWWYFASGGFDGSGIDIKVDGVYNTEGQKEEGCSATLDISGNLTLNNATIEKATKDNPLTVIMHIDYDSNYKGSDAIDYLLTADGKQNLTYSADWNTAGYFAIKVYNANSTPDIEIAKVIVDKVDEYGKPVEDCTFEIEGIDGEAKDNAYKYSLTTKNDEENFFEIEYPGTYVIRETGVPEDGEYQLNTDEYTFYAVKVPKLLVIGEPQAYELILTTDPKATTGLDSLTYTYVNESTEGGAKLTKYGTLLTKYEDGKFVYDKQNLSGVGFSFYAAEDIYVNTTKVFSKGQEIKNGATWGKAHKVTISNNNHTDQNGNITIAGLPAGDYFCRETDYLSGFAKITKRFDFTVKPNTLTEINGQTGIINESVPADVIVTKKDIHGEEPLTDGEFTLYAHVTNKAYNGSALFTQSQTSPAVIKRNLLTGEETVAENEWVRLSTKNSDEDGRVNFEDLPYGRYLVAETKAPEGYALAEESYEFTHTADAEQGSNGFVFTHTFLDEQDRHFYIIKHAEKAERSGKDTQSSELYVYHDKPVSGVKYGIYASENINNTLGEKVLSEDEQVGVCETDADGKASYEGHLYFGKYYFKELQTADDRIYILDDTKYSFSVSADSPEQINEDPVINRQYKGSIKVIKTDGENKIPLSGVTFDLLDENSHILGTYLTDDKGEIQIVDLPVGTYYLQEKGALQNYYLDRETKEVTIDKDHLNRIVNIDNRRMKGSIKVIKTDGNTKKKLQGVQFELRDDKDQICGSYTTDENGEIYIDNLELGYYYLKETATLKGYRLPKDAVEVAVLPETLHQIIQIKNEKEETTPVPDSPDVGKTKTGDDSLTGMVERLLFWMSLTVTATLLLKKNIEHKRKRTERQNIQE